MKDSIPQVLVVGAGLAGVECAFYLAEKGVSVHLAEAKGIKLGPAQKTTDLAELVCTNSLKSSDPNSAHGLLKGEMRTLGSLVLRVAASHQVPAGSALAVDRIGFAEEITKEIKNHPRIKFLEQDVGDPLELKKELGCEYVVVATGPLSTENITNWIQQNLSRQDLYFYDAIAPVVDADSLDKSKLYYKDRYQSPEEGEEPDYLNCPLNKEQYESFIEELVKAEKVQPQNFEDPKFFEACLPVDLMAERGKETARFSCMKPVGLEQEDGKIPYAAIQLRKENLLGSAYNLVGFQNRLTYKEQVRIFRMLPGFEEASFIHLGSVHRNSFLNARNLLNFDLSSKQFPELHFAGQITGVEGYTESASMGLYVGTQIWRKIQNEFPQRWPVTTGIGALVNYVLSIENPTPSNINFGLFPEIDMPKKRLKRSERKKLKKKLICDRARESFQQQAMSFIQ